MPGTDNMDVAFQYWNGAWNTAHTKNLASPGYGNVTASFAPIAATIWRWVMTYNGGGVGFIRFNDSALYGSTTKQPIVSQFYAASGVSEGGNRWVADEWGTPSSAPGYFYALAYGERNNRFYAAGSTNTDNLNLSANNGTIGCVTTSGVTEWYKTYPQVSAFYDIAAAEDGGFFLSGTLYSGTSVQARQAVIMKIDKDGNVDPRFPQYFTEEGQWADGRGIIETRDGGAVWVGGSSRSDANISRPYYGKLDKFLRSRTKGKLYN
jgi:hypothetical protein